MPSPERSDEDSFEQEDVPVKREKIDEHSTREKTRRLLCFDLCEVGLKVSFREYSGLLLSTDSSQSSEERRVYFLFYQESENNFQLAYARMDDESWLDNLIKDERGNIFSEIKVEEHEIEGRILKGVFFTFKRVLPLGYAYDPEGRKFYKYDFEAGEFKEMKKKMSKSAHLKPQAL